MGWLTGLLSGFNTRNQEIAAEKRREAELASIREGQVFETLLNARDPEIKALAAAGLLESAGPKRRAGGIAGWLGEMQKSKYLPALQAAQARAAAGGYPDQDEYDDLTLPRQPSVPPQAGAITTPRPQVGSAALPATSPTVAGSPPVTTPAPVPGAGGAAGRPPTPPFPVAPYASSGPGGGPPTAAAAAGASGLMSGASVAASPVGTPLPGAGAQSGPPKPPTPTIEQQLVQNGLPVPPALPAKKTDLTGAPPLRSRRTNLSIFPSAAELAVDKEDAEFGGKIDRYTRMYVEGGDAPPVARAKAIKLVEQELQRAAGRPVAPYQLVNIEYEDATGQTIQRKAAWDKFQNVWVDEDQQPINPGRGVIRQVYAPIDFGDEQETAASVLFQGKRFADLKTPQQRALAAQYANVLRQSAAYFRATGTQNAAFEKQRSAIESQATQLEVGGRDSDLVPDYKPNPAPTGGNIPVPDVTPTPGATGAGTGGPTVTPAPTGAGATQKPAARVIPRVATDPQRTAARYFGRAADAVDRLVNLTDPNDPDFGTLEDRISEQGRMSAIQGKWFPTLGQTDMQQQYVAIQRAFTEARLRQESGAAVPPHEYEQDAQTYFFQPGNSPETMKIKQEMRNQVIDGMAYAAGPAFAERYNKPYTPRAKEPGPTVHFEKGANPDLSGLNLTMTASGGMHQTPTATPQVVLPQGSGRGQTPTTVPPTTTTAPPRPPAATAGPEWQTDAQGNVYFKGKLLFPGPK